MNIQYQKSLTVPYRICPLGAHVDHQKGIVHGFAIDKGITLSFNELRDSVRIRSINFDGEIDFSLNEPLIKNGNWGDYAKAAAYSLRSCGYELKHGFEGIIKGDLPVGGLSSSAAVIISYLKAFCLLNGISLSEESLIKIAHRAETEFIGLNCGTLDQSCEVLCRKENLLMLDTLDASFENIPFCKSMPEFEIAVVFSGLEHALVSSKYNLRTDELKAAAYSLKAYSNNDYGRMDGSVLREIPFEAYSRYCDRLPENFRKRCDHYYGEQKRVAEGTQAFRKGNLHEYGRLIFESGDSSIHNYEAGSPELIRLHEIIKNTDGVYGGRFSGAGFKGCCMALIDPKFKKSFSERIKNEYIKSFPGLKDKFSINFCKTADGCGAINKG